MTKLPDVRGRVDYISNPKRQEHLYATYTTVEPAFWKYLAEQAQFDFRKSNQKRGKCVEARELVIALPESLQQFDPDFMLRLFTESFRTKYGVQCTSALHHNKKKSNYHIHLIFADREPLAEKEIKYAPRNMFYDESGRHVRTKKEILDADKIVRPGCRIIPKGEIYEIRYFSERRNRFKEKSFLEEVKDMYTDLINQCVPDEKDKLQVFDKSGPYLPTKKIGKNNPKAKVIEADNGLRKEWNCTVDQVLIAGGTQEEVTEFKKEFVTDKVSQSIRTNGQKPGIFASVLTQAIDILKKYLRFLMFRREKAEQKAAISTNEKQPVPEQEEQQAVAFDPAELQRARADYMRLQIMHNDLDALNRKIYAIDRTIQNLNRQLKALENSIADKILHTFERKELNKKIATEKAKLKLAKEELELYPAQHGFDSIRSIEEAYRKATAEYDSLIKKREMYNKSCSATKAKQVVERLEIKEETAQVCKSSRQSVAHKKSVLKNLAEKQQLVDETNRTTRNQSHRVNRRKGMERRS